MYIAAGQGKTTPGDKILMNWKNRSFDHPQAELDILSFQKSYKLGHGNQRPEIELIQAFVPVLVTSNYDNDSIKNEWASMETPFSHYKSMGKFLDLKGTKSVVSGPIWPKFEHVRDFMHVLVICKYKKDQIKNNQEKVETSFSPL